MTGTRPAAGDLFAKAVAYPLDLEILLLIGIGSFLIWIAATSPFGLPMLVILLNGMAQFLFLSIEHSAAGHDSPPSVDARRFFEFGATPFLWLAVLSIALAAAGVAGHWHRAAGLTVTFAEVVLLPAFTALLALDNSALHALHPRRLLEFVWRGGWLYAALVVISTPVLYLAVSGLGDSLLAARSVGVFRVPSLATLGWLVATLYLAVAFTHALGKLTFRIQKSDPYGQETPRIVRVKSKETAADYAESLSDALYAGDTEAVSAEWRSLSARDHVFQAELLNALQARHAKALIPAQAQRTVTRQLQAGRRAAALTTAVHTLTTNPAFETRSKNEWLELCRIAADQKRVDWLERLAECAARRHPNDHILLDIALLRARLTAEHDNDVDAALACLTPFLDAESHPRHAELAALHKTLRALANDA